jgi:two-component system sensor histidine kinase UhpB
MERPKLSLYWRVFAVNTALLTIVTVVLLVTPVTISAPVALTEVLVVVAGLAVTIAANAFLLRQAFRSLERLAQRMEMVDLLRPGQRLPVLRADEVGRVVIAFNRMLDRLETERRESGRRVLAAQEAERVAVARDLHDEVGQLLTGVLLLLNADDPELAEARQAVREALDEVRRISSELRPEMLETLGLVSALTELSTSFARVADIRVERRLDTHLPALEPDVELAVYRIAQESLTNIARHAGATAAVIELEAHPTSVVLRVADDGRGLPAPPSERGGLRGMRERAVLIGAALAVARAPEGGVEVRLELPVAAA